LTLPLLIMKKNLVFKSWLVLTLILLFGTNTYSQTVFSEWMVGAGKQGWDIVNDIACDDSGNVFITGSNMDTVIKTRMTGVATNSRKGMFIAKYDSAGKFLWNKNILKQSSGFGSLISIGKENQIILAGGTTIDESESGTKHGKFGFFISSLNEIGKINWITKFSGVRSDFLTSMIVDTLRNEILLAGYFHDTLIISGKTFINKGRADGFLFRFDMNGAFKEAQIIGGKGDDKLYCTAINTFGDLFIAGTYQRKIQFSKNKSLELSSPNQVGLFISKLNDSGECVAAKQLLSGKKIKVNHITWMDGLCFITGGFSDNVNIDSQVLRSLGSEDIFLLCVDSSLQVKWYKQIGGIKKDRSAGIINTGKEIILTGSFCSEIKMGQKHMIPSGKGSDIFLMSFDTKGTLKWMRSAGGDYDDYPTCIEYGHDNYIYVAGSFRNSFKLNSATMNSNGEEDLFICRLENCRIKAPEFKQPEYLCDGFPLKLDAGPGFSSYNWADGLGYEQVFTINQGGNYSLDLVAPNGCMIYDTIGVIDSPSPVVYLGNDTTIADTSRIFLNAGKNFTHYLWNNGATKPEIQVKGIDLHEGPNLMNVTVTSEEGCVGHDDIVIEMLRTMPNYNSELIAESCILFPNPTRDIVTVSFTIPFESLTLTIHDLMGKEVMSNSVSQYVTNFPIELNLGSLPKGLYTLKINTNRGNATKKIVLQ